MRRTALLGTAVFGLVMGIAACGSSPVGPGTSTAALDPATASLGKRKTSPPPPVTGPACESLVYPTSLCMPANRPALCAALRATGTFSDPVVGRAATQTFARNATGTASVETVVIPRPYGLPPTVLTFTISNTQIESTGMCLGVA